MATESLKEKLAKRAKVKDEVGKKRKEFIMSLEGAISEEADILCAALHAKDSVISHEKRARALIIDPLRRRIYAEWIKAGKRLESPIINTLTGSHFSLQCRDTTSGPRGFKLRADKGLTIEDHLRNNEVSETLFGKVADDFVESLTLTVDLPKIEEKQPELAERIMKLIEAACSGGVRTEDDELIQFTDEESTIILEQVTQIKVKEGFLDRAIGYAKEGSEDLDDAVERLESLINAVSPSWAVAQVHCADPAHSMIQLIAAPPAAEKTGKAQDFETVDKKYLLRVVDNVVTVFKKEGGDLRELCKKECKDNPHALNTVRKFMREPKALLEFVAENV